MEVRRGRRLQRFVNCEGYMLEEPSWAPQSAILDKTMLRDKRPDKPGGSPEGRYSNGPQVLLCVSLSVCEGCGVFVCVLTSSPSHLK